MNSNQVKTMVDILKWVSKNPIFTVEDVKTEFGLDNFAWLKYRNNLINLRFIRYEEFPNREYRYKFIGKVNGKKT